jgi:hypothetical protein
VSLTAKFLGVVVPVFVSATLCLTVPFIIFVADGAILAAALVTLCASRPRPAPDADDALADD